MYMSYLSVHIVIMYIDLIEAFGNLESMVGNIIDNTIATTTYFILFLLRFNKLIEHGIVTVREEIAKSKFETVEEMRLYFTYHNISDKFGRYAISTTLVIATLWYLSPMLQLLKLDSGISSSIRGEKKQFHFYDIISGQSNESSKAYKLPFRAYAFLDYQDDFQNFVIMYLYQFPVMFIALSHISAISLLVNLVLHICGKFSILSYRIQNISTNSNVNLDSVIKEFVTAHVKLIT
ncbi:uncharacterized protein LOC126878229 [Bombus huntii]|uniref:uncharacterized protein LOC126878229 n=1 Tax=Bombus huntii TaxID=85661 RepID=UPI0021AA76BD|nr:uncharacterized protein LOC126878229 [Bombus huntii]